MCRRQGQSSKRVIFEPSGATALKIDMILYWTSLRGLRNTSRNHRLWTQFAVQFTHAVKAASCKEGAICEQDPEMPPSSLGQSSSKMVWGQVENCSVVRRINIFNSFWKPRTSRPADWSGRPACNQWTVQEPAPLMLWGCISAYGAYSLHIWKGSINAEEYVETIEQNLPPSRRRLFQERPKYFSKRMINHILHPSQ